MFIFVKVSNRRWREAVLQLLHQEGVHESSRYKTALRQSPFRKNHPGFLLLLKTYFISVQTLRFEIVFLLPLGFIE